ncbi:MAG: zinc ribbon domain-containing protein, partial [Gemmatimonadota bacterium]
PKFKRWTGDGLVGVQIQKGMETQDVFGADRKLQIDPIPETAWNRRRSSEQRTKVRLRVGSEGRDPIWAEWPVILHRPLPPGKIMWAKVLRRHVANKERWELQITVRLDDGPISVPREGTVGVDLGWRLVDDGLRAGYWGGSDGKHEQILVGDDIVTRMQKVEDLRSIRDKHLDELRPWMAKWLQDHRNEIPEWIRERTETLHAWKAFRKFGSLAIAWRTQRWEGDEEAFERLEDWRQRDKHLWTWEAHQRQRTLRRRREGYRLLAADLAKRYGTLVLEDFDLSEMQERSSVEEEKEKGENKEARRNRVLVACSELRLCLINAFQSAGGRVVKIDPAYTTQECWICGAVENWSDSAEEQVVRTCLGCGMVVDQDENAARILLDRHKKDCERRGGDSKGADVAHRDSGGLEGDGGRWKKRKLKRLQRESQDGVGA